MGDRCYQGGEVRKQDLHLFTELGLQVSDYCNDSLPDGVAYVEDDQANYANYPHLGELAAKGIPFLFHNSEGGEYPACITASDGKRFIDIPALDQYPVAKVLEDGTVDGLEQAKEYWDIYRAARLALGYPAESEVK